LVGEIPKVLFFSFCCVSFPIPLCRCHHPGLPKLISGPGPEGRWTLITPYLFFPLLFASGKRLHPGSSGCSLSGFSAPLVFFFPMISCVAANAPVVSSLPPPPPPFASQGLARKHSELFHEAISLFVRSLWRAFSCFSFVFFIPTAKNSFPQGLLTFCPVGPLSPASFFPVHLYPHT